MWKVLMLNKRCRKTHLFIEYEHRMYKVEEKMKIYQNVKENRKEMRREKVKINLRIASASAKSLQLYPTLSDPIDGSPPGSPVPGILQARTLEWVATSFSYVLFC